MHDEPLRSGSCVTWPLVRAALVVLASAYFATWVFLLTRPGLVDPGGNRVGSDFAAFYGVSRALLDGVPASVLYEPEALNAAVAPYTNGKAYLWLYPPTAFLPYWQIGRLPYLAALASWFVVWLALGLAAVWRVLPGSRALAAAALFPPVFVTSLHGHNSVLLAACGGWGLVLLPARPFAAGLLLGALTLKPHLALLVPVALAVSGRWRALFGAGASFLGLTALSLALFGRDAFAAFLRSSDLARSMLEQGSVPHHKIASAFSAVRVLGGGVPMAYLVQAVVTAATGIAIIALWRSRAPYAVKAAGLAIGTALATPYVYDYDLCLAGLGLAFLASAANATGWLHWEKTAIAAAWLLPLVGRFLARAQVPLVPVLLALVLLLIVRRAFARNAPSQAGGRALAAVVPPGV